MKKPHQFLAALLLAQLCAGLEAQLFVDDFEAYTAGDGISTASDVDPWVLWSNLDTEEAFISEDVALSGTKSLKIEGSSAAGGPQDIVLVAGLDGQYEVTFSMFVPEGNSGYYNVQENQIQGTTWAFETTLGSDGTISFDFDGVVLLTGQYTSNSWVTISHYIDTDSDLMNVFINGEFLGQAPYDGGQVGGLNFYALGDTQTLPLFYVDDVIVDIADPVVVPQQEGCTDAAACNYSPSAQVDDGSCDFSCYGCTDPAASNYDSDAFVEDGSCIFFELTCDYLGAQDWEGLEFAVFNETDLTFVQGVEGLYEVVLNVPSVVTEPSTGTTYGILSWTPTGIVGLPDNIEISGLEGASPASQQCLSVNGIGWQVGTYGAVLSGNLVVSIFGSPFDLGNFPLSVVLEVIANPEGILGCTYSNASNYLPYATIDDGSCGFAGCTSPQANNYQMSATEDDGSCEFEDCVSTCPGDLDGDGTVGTPDLLALLSSFGLSCE